MKRFALLVLTLALALCLSACGGGRPDDPLLFLPAEKDGLYLTDRGTLRVDDGFVTGAAFVIEGEGVQEEVFQGGLTLPAVSALPRTTGMTVGQFRTVLSGLLRQVPRNLDTVAYLLVFCPADGGTEAPAWTYSLSGGTLIQGMAEGADPALGSFLVDDAGLLAQIHLAP